MDANRLNTSMRARPGNLNLSCMYAVEVRQMNNLFRCPRCGGQIKRKHFPRNEYSCIWGCGTWMDKK